MFPKKSPKFWRIVFYKYVFKENCDQIKTEKKKTKWVFFSKVFQIFSQKNLQRLVAGNRVSIGRERESFISIGRHWRNQNFFDISNGYNIISFGYLTMKSVGWYTREFLSFFFTLTTLLNWISSIESSEVRINMHYNVIVQLNRFIVLVMVHFIGPICW